MTGCGCDGSESGVTGQSQRESLENNEIVEIGGVLIRKAETKLIFNLQTNYGVCRFIYWSGRSLQK